MHSTPRWLTHGLMPEGLFVGPNVSRRNWVMTLLLLLILSAATLGGYANEAQGQDPWVSWLATGVFLLLFGALRWGASYVAITHLTFLSFMAYVVWWAAYTGGIHSPTMVWMTVITLPAILLLGKRSAVFWVLIALGCNSLMLWFTMQGAVDARIDVRDTEIVWALVAKLCVVCIAMFVAYLSERMHRMQVNEIDRSNAALEETHQALARAQAHKDEFVASVGHELRTPMNAILGLNGILRTELQAQPQEVEVVDHIRRSTEQLLQVVNDILDFSQLQAGRLSLHEENFALAPTVAAVLAQYEDKARAKGLALRLDTRSVDTLWIRADRQRLMQVLKNLIDNAMKFTAQGHIQVRVQTVGMGCLFEVEDTGIGVATDRQQQIFNRFEHADVQTNRQFGGTGLGLSICERLVSLQGGSIGVHSVPGQGARFWFQLPLQVVASQDGLAAAEMARRLAHRALRILLVDDNAVNLMVAKLMLKQCFPHAQITQATGGAEALAHLRQASFDVMLLDMVMPDVDGLAVIRSLRDTFDAPVRDLPVLALTASANPVDHDKCLAAGMNEVLNKPLDQQQLLDKMSAVLASLEPGGTP
jgi:signal transduction histidine kinase/ActR/RegA family two-component response regulator